MKKESTVLKSVVAPSLRSVASVKSLILGSLALIAAASTVSAANITLTANDALNTSSYNGTGATPKWSDSLPPNPTNDYFTAGFMLRTPFDNVNGSNHVFQGASLTLQAPTLAGAGNGSLLEKYGGGAGAGRIITINNLTNAAAALVRSGDANGVIVHIAGNHWTIAGSSELRADQNIWIVDSPFLGNDAVILTNGIPQALNRITLSNNNAGFSGSFYVTAVPNGIFELATTTCLPANPSSFNPSQITLFANAVLLDSAGNTFNSANGGITLAGVNSQFSIPNTTTIAQPITGDFALTKIGGGTLILSGVNTYTNGTVVTAGLLRVGSATAIPVGNATVNGSLDLNAFSVTVDGLSGAGSVDTSAAGSPVLTIGVNGASSTFGGIIGNSVGTLSLSKAGAGSITLSGGYTYSGQTLVSGGSLNLTTVAPVPGSPGNLIVSNGATLTVNANVGVPLPAAGVVVGTNSTMSLTLNSTTVGLSATSLTLQDNATNNFIYGSLGGNPTATSVINVAGGISAPGANIVINISALGLTSGQFTLIDYTGTPLANLANFILISPPGVVATLSNNTANTSIDIVITSAPRAVSWYGTANGTWDFNTANWKTSGLDTVYQQYTNGSIIAGDGVLFDDTLTNDFVNPQPTNITLTASFYPFPVTIDSALPYSFSGAGQLIGPSSLVKSNTGSLTLNTSNLYSGGTFIYGGSVIITNDTALGTTNGLLSLGGGTLQVNGSLTNNARNLTVTADSSVAIATNIVVRLGGNLNGGGGLTKADAGTLTLAGSNGITGAFVVGQGTLNVANTNILPGVVTVGNTVGNNAQLNVSGGIFNARNNAGQFTSGLIAGSVAGSAGDIRVTGGTLSVQQQLGLGAGAGGYGGLTMTAGSLNSGSFIVVGFNNDNAVFNQSGGSTLVSNNLMTIAAGGAAAFGVANFSGGTYIATNGITGNNTTRGGLFVGENGIGILNVSGSATITASGQANLTLGRTGAGSAGTVNLLGGTIVTPQVARGAGSAIFNFNGGTLRAGAANASFISGLSSAVIYTNGAIIDDGGFAITIPQVLQSASGFGVSSITLASGGAGYIDTPVVVISGGTGTGATANAIVSGGTVTALTVTSPGSGYGSGDVLSVTIQGGGGTGAAANPPVLAANVTGGLTKRGSGTTILTGVNNNFVGPITNIAGTLFLNSATTYSGPVRVNAGTLAMTTATILTGSATVSNNATLSISQVGSATSSLGSLTYFGSTTVGGVLGLGIGPANNSAVPLVNSGTLTVTGTNTINLAGAVKLGVTKLVQYTGAIAGTGNITNLVLPQGASGFISNDVANSTLNVVVTSTGPGLVWTGTNSNPTLTNLWDINSTVNWLVGSSTTTYRQSIVPGDAVTFNDVGNGSVTLNTNVGPASVVFSNNSKTYTLRGNGTISGPTGLTKLGSGTAILNLTNNSYAGDTTVSNGTLQAGSASAVSPTANLVIGPSGTFEMGGFNQTVGSLTGSGILNNGTGIQIGLTVGSAGGGVWNGTIKDIGAGGLTLTKVGNNNWFVGGSNFLNNGDAFTITVQFNGGTTFITNNGLIRVPHMETWIAQNAGSTGAVVVAGGTLAVSNNWLVIGRNAASASGSLTVNSGTVIKAGNGNLVVGSLGAQGTLTVNGGQVLNTSQLWIGEAATANAVFNLNGGLVQASVVRPNGATPASAVANFNGGTLQATANNANFLQVQSMIFSNGLVLDDNGFALNIGGAALQAGDGNNGGLIKKGSGSVYLDAANSYTGTTVVTNGLLAGIGSIAGPVVVGPAGKIGAGDAAGFGLLTINNSLAIQGGANFRVDKTGGVPNADRIDGLSTVNYGGLLVISNATSDATLLVNGDTFTLFNATTHVGNFSGIAGSPGPGLAYSFANGILSVIAVPSTPTNITVSVNGNNITIGWPSGYTGWILQAQTNSAFSGLSTNWVDVTGSAGANSVTMPINQQNPNVFFRLRYP